MRTTFLLAIPNFISGFARVLDLGCVYDSYNKSRNGNEADDRALYSDFRMVGQDLQQAMKIFNSAPFEESPGQQLALAFQQKDAAVGYGEKE